MEELNKKSKRKVFAEKLTHKYLVILRDANSLEIKWTVRLTPITFLGALLTPMLIFLVFGLVSGYQFRKTMVTDLPSEVLLERDLIRLAVRTDSLERLIEQRNRYIANIRNVINGEKLATDIDSSLVNTSKVDLEVIDLDHLSESDKKLRKEFEERNRNLASVPVSQNSTELNYSLLYPPVEGLISAGFAPQNNHYGIDIVAKQGEPVRAVETGVVILSTYTDKTGYIIAIQHRNNLVSVYKHNESLEKREGELVNTGDILGFVGNTGELTTGPHLHFELWVNGRAADPLNFIKL